MRGHDEQSSDTRPTQETQTLQTETAAELVSFSLGAKQLEVREGGVRYFPSATSALRQERSTRLFQYQNAFYLFICTGALQSFIYIMIPLMV